MLNEFQRLTPPFLSTSHMIEVHTQRHNENDALEIAGERKIAYISILFRQILPTMLRPHMSLEIILPLR